MQIRELSVRYSVHVLSFFCFALREAKIKIEEVDEIILVGGFY